MKWSRNRAATIVALGAASAMVLAACSSTTDTPASPDPTDTETTDPTDDPGDGPSDPVTLTIASWGNFGLNHEDDSLINEYMEANPHVTIEESVGDYNAQHEALQQFLVAGTGAPDIAAIDEGFIVGFRNQAEQFANLLDYGAGEFESAYLPWKWEQSLSPDGSRQIGLGTDVGPLATCYRPDLLRDAGLPSERDEVSAAIGGSWDDFIAFGEQYNAATGKPFVSSAAITFMASLGQQPVGSYTENEELALDGGPKVAFDLAIDLIGKGLTSGLANPWDPAFAQAVIEGEFVTTFCPAWMLGHIRSTAQDEDGNILGEWDLADIPGPGGNWGGSFFTIPEQGQNKEEAYKLLSWLVQPEQQLRIFKLVGNLPSQPALLTGDDIQSYVAEDFNNAPTGAIFAQSALDLQPQYQGRQSSIVRTEIENVLNSVEGGSIPADTAWDTAVANVNSNVD